MASWNITTFLVWQLGVFWAMLCVSVIVLLLTQHIQTAGVLRARTASGAKTHLSFARLQFLFVILLGIAVYLYQLYQGPVQKTIFNVPTVMLVLMGCSNALYLFSKLKSANRHRFDKEHS